MDRRAAVTQLKAMYAMLDADCEEARQYGLQQQSHFALRSAIRTFFAMVEGITYQLRLTTVVSLQHVQHLLSDKDRLLLLDVAKDIGMKVAPLKLSRQSFKDTFRHALKVYPKIHGADFQPDWNSQGWRDFCSSIQVRDRLMHPKSLDSLDISVDENRAMGSAIEWWRATMVAMFAACEAADKRYRTMTSTATNV